MRAKVARIILARLPTEAPGVPQIGDVFYAPSPVGPALWVLMSSRPIAVWQVVPVEEVEQEGTLILPAGLIGFLAMVAQQEPARAKPLHRAAYEAWLEGQVVSDGA